MNDEFVHAALNAQKWDTRARNFDRKVFDLFRYLQRRVVDAAAPEPGTRFLDIGCGTGWAVRHAREVAGKGEFVGVDLAPKMLEKAQANAAGMHGVRFANANAESLPFADGSFDIVICTLSFHHYLNPGRAVAEVRRVLAEGGRYLLLDIAPDGPIGWLIESVTHAVEREHVRYHATGELRGIFEASGLVPVETRRLLGPVTLQIARRP